MAGPTRKRKNRRRANSSISKGPKKALSGSVVKPHRFTSVAPTGDNFPRSSGKTSGSSYLSGTSKAHKLRGKGKHKQVIQKASAPVKAGFSSKHRGTTKRKKAPIKYHVTSHHKGTTHRTMAPIRYKASGAEPAVLNHRGGMPIKYKFSSAHAGTVNRRLGPIKYRAPMGAKVNYNKQRRGIH